MSEAVGRGRGAIPLAIVGGGAGAMEFLIHLLDLAGAETAFAVKVFEPRAELWRGIAWRGEKAPVLANLRSEDLGPSLQRSDIFLNLLKEMRHAEAGQEFATRGAVGDAMLERWRRRSAELPEGWSIEHIPSEAVDLCWSKDGAEVSCRDGARFPGFAYVLLAVGNLRTAPPAELDGRTRYVNGWDVAALEQVDPAGDVLIQGSGLTAIDATMRLLGSGVRRRGSIVWRSRTGALPYVRPRRLTLEPVYLSPERMALLVEKLAAEGRELTLATVMQLFALETAAQSRKEAGRYAAGSEFAAFLALWRELSGPAQGKGFLRHGLERAQETSLWFSVLKLMDETLIPFLWNHLPEREKAVFQERFRREFDRLWAPIPERNARRILGWLEEGSVQLLCGEMSLAADGDGRIPFDARLRDPLGERRPDELRERYKAGFAYFVEATGIPTDLTQVESPLVARLLERGTLTPYCLRSSDGLSFPVRGAQVEWRTGAVLAPDGRPHGWLYTLTGSLTAGAHCYTNSYVSVASSAQWAAVDLMRRMQGELERVDGPGRAS